MDNSKRTTYLRTTIECDVCFERKPRKHFLKLYRLSKQGITDNVCLDCDPIYHVCSKCGDKQIASEFLISYKGTPTGQCLSCKRDTSSASHARKMGVVVEDVPGWLEILEYQDNKCAFCRQYANEWHLDHIVPLVHGGSHTRDNLQVLCKSCNLKKGNKTQEEFEYWMNHNI